MPVNMPPVRVPFELLLRILREFMNMTKQGAQWTDPTLMQDLDEVLASHDRRTRP